jgi:hypothetical protein
MSIQTAITLNSVTTTEFTITVTEFGRDADFQVGSSTDNYRIEFINVTDGGENYAFTTTPNYFTLNVAKTISLTGAFWGGNEPIVTVGDSITVELYNDTLRGIPRSDAEPGTVTAANGPTLFTVNSFTTTAITITITDYGRQGSQIGSPSDKYEVTLTSPTSISYTFTPTAGGNFPSAGGGVAPSQPVVILFSDGQWSPAPVANGGDLFSVKIEDVSSGKGNIGDTTLTNQLVTGGGGGGGGIPCFVAASNLLTPTGYKSAKDIKTGDLLMTADGRQVAVKSYSFTVEKADKESAPFFIPKNSISMGCPNADLRLSPWHAFQMKKGLWMKPMSAFELGMSVQQYDLGKSVTYYHFEAPDFFKDNFVCEGTIVESFGGLQIKGMKGRPYTFNANLKGYTRVASKSVNKAIMM